MADRAIRVVLANGQRVVLQALARALAAEPGLEVVAVCESGREVADRVPATRPHVVVLDVVLPVVSGLDTTVWLQEHHPGVEVVVLTAHHNEAYQRRAFETGARGYLAASCSLEDLASAIRHAARGDYFVAGAAGRDLVEAYVRPGLRRRRPGGVITPRERELAVLLADGYSTKEAAAVLDISPKTAETHRASLMKKLGARNVTDVVRYCIRSNLVDV